MPKFTQNLVVLIDPSKNAYNISSKGANMYFNRFCIDEDAGFECSGVLYLKKSSFDLPIDTSKDERIIKGKWC